MSVYKYWIFMSAIVWRNVYDLRDWTCYSISWNIQFFIEWNYLSNYITCMNGNIVLRPYGITHAMQCTIPNVAVICWVVPCSTHACAYCTPMQCCMAYCALVCINPQWGLINPCLSVRIVMIVSNQAWHMTTNPPIRERSYAEKL